MGILPSFDLNLAKLPSFQNIGESLGAALGQKIAGPVGAIIGGNLGADLGKDVGELGENKVDQSAPPAGVDSAATTLPVSQTSMLENFTGGGEFGMSPMQSNVLAFPNLVTQFLPKLLPKTAVGGLATGLAAGEVVDFFVDQFGQQKKLVITRKMQRDVKKLFMMSGGDFNMTAELYRMATGRRISGEQVVKIITKTFKNQGPFVTKAAVRKTRATIRKMETLCDLKDRLCPPKRRAPARRRTMSAQTITQVK